MWIVRGHPDLGWLLTQESWVSDFMVKDNKQKQSPFFSVIVPTYNNERELNKCVDSILTQSCEDFELILVDDGSTDATPEICDAYALQDSRVQVIHKENQGVAAARNDGLFCAAGKYVYYADADDWIEQGLFQEAISILGKPDPPDIFVFGYTRLLENGEKVSDSWPLKPGRYNKRRLEEEIYPRMMRILRMKQRRRLISPSLWNKIIKKTLLLSHYCHDMSLFYHEDFVCSYECVYFADHIYFSCSDFYVYNQRSESSMSRRYHPDLFRNNRAVAQYLRTCLGGQESAFIGKQITELEFDDLITAACQEIRFSSSLWQAANRFKAILQLEAERIVCPMRGLSFPSQCCILLLSLRVVYPAMLVIKFLCRIKGIPTKIDDRASSFDTERKRQ